MNTRTDSTPTLPSLFSTSMKWLFIEQGLYHIILLSHQLLLSSVLGWYEYGKVGSFFSILYLLTALFNGGLDQAFGSFFKRASQTKTLFKKQILTPLLIQTCIAIAASILCLSFFRQHIPIYDHNSTIIVMSLGLLTVIEGLRKNIRSLLHLSFMNKTAALTELLFVISYVTCIWITYIAGYPVSMSNIIGYLALCSLVNTGILIFLLGSLYKSAPNDLSQNYSINIKEVLFLRFSVYGNVMTGQFFSSNVMIPLFTRIFGFAEAGILTFMSSIMYSISSIIRKTFGPGGIALFSYVKHDELDNKKFIFARLSGTLIALLSVLAIGITLCASYIAHITTVDTRAFFPVLIFIALQLIEHVSIPYEKFLIVEDRSHYLLTINFIELGTALSAATFFKDYLHIFYTCILIRIIGIGACLLITYLQWGIKPIQRHRL